MKTFLFLVFCCALALSARADVPPARKTIVTLSNLAAFPKFHFFYMLGGRLEGSKPETLRPIEDKKPFEDFGAFRLIVRDDKGETEWGSVKANWDGGVVTVQIQDVKREGAAIKVDAKFDRQPLKGPPPKPLVHPIPGSPLGYFFFAGASMAGLAVVARRRRPDSSPSH